MWKRPRNIAEALALFGREPDIPSPAAARLARALAERLDAVVPAPFRVRAEGGYVSKFNGDLYDGSSDVSGVLDWDPSEAREAGWEPEERPLAQRVASCSGSVLSSVQDMISVDTTEPWPRLPQGGMATPGSRADAERVYLWYGPHGDREEGAVLSLPPIALAELQRD